MMWTHRVHKYIKYIWSVKGHSGSLQDIYVYKQWKLVRGLQCSCTLYYIAKLVWWTNPIDVIMIVHTQARKSWWTVAKMASLKLLILLILLGLGYSRTASSKQKPQNSTSVVVVVSCTQHSGNLILQETVTYNKWLYKYFLWMLMSVAFWPACSFSAIPNPLPSCFSVGAHPLPSCILYRYEVLHGNHTWACPFRAASA